MNSCHGKPVQGDVVKFYSGAQAPHCLLSNFSACRVYYEGEWYPSSEHAFQASMVPQETRKKLFSVESDIAELTPAAFVAVGVPAKDAEKKVKYWGKKNMIGVLAKQRINRISSKLTLSKEDCESVFIEILLSKYRQNEEHRKTLLSTGDAFLLEFVRSSAAKFDSEGKIDRWGGMVRDGHVVGHNQQGSLQMHVRSILQKEEQ